MLSVLFFMGLFSKTPKLNPKITFEGIEVSFHREHEWWEFKYRGVEFISYGVALMMPTKAELDVVLEDLESLKPEIRSRLEKGLAEWADSKLDEGETFTVDVNDFVASKTFSVSWSGGASWGDMGADFVIKNHEVIDEAWGD